MGKKSKNKTAKKCENVESGNKTLSTPEIVVTASAVSMVAEASNAVPEVSVTEPVQSSDKAENYPVVHVDESKSNDNAEGLTKEAGKRKRNKKKKGTSVNEAKLSQVNEPEKAKDSVCPAPEVLQTATKPDTNVNQDKQNNNLKTSTVDLVKASPIAEALEVTKKEGAVIKLEESSSSIETEKTKGGKKKRNKNKKSGQIKETSSTAEQRTETTKEVEGQSTSSQVDVPKLEQKDEVSNLPNQDSDSIATIKQDVKPDSKTQSNTFETAVINTQYEVMQAAEVTSEHDTKIDFEEVASKEHEKEQSINVEEEKVQKMRIYSLSRLLDIFKTITLVKPQLQCSEKARVTPHKQPVVFEMPQVSSTARWASLPIESSKKKAFLGIDHENIVLHKSSTAWQTTRKSKEDVDSLVQTLRGLLNKLSPDNFGKILNEIRGISFDTLGKLAAFIKELFEKAVREPGFSPTYARLALNMSLLSVQDGDKTVTFKTLIIRECQAEFEKDKTDEKILNDLTEKISSAKTDMEKKLLTDEKQMAIFKTKKRSLGNIKFIGELFKLNMLSEPIMITCINKLMQKSGDEESMECVCQLLSTIGKSIDSKSKTKIDVLMNELAQLVAKKTTSSRIRFMIMDVIDLRKSGWVTKNNEVPTTIEEVHKNAEREKQRTTTYENRPAYRAGPYRAKKDEGSPFFRDFLTSHVKTGKDIKKVKKEGDSVKKPQYEIKRSKFDALRKLCEDEDEKPQKKISVKQFPKNQSSENSGKSVEEVKRVETGNRVETVSLVPDQKVISRSEMELKVKSRIDEFLSLKDMNEALESIKELSTDICHANAVRFFYISFSQNFEKSSEVRNQIGHLHRNVLDKKIASVEAYIDASIKFSNFASDMVVDIPQIWTYISELVTPVALDSEVIKIGVVARGSTSPDAELDEDLSTEDGDYSAMLLAAFLNGVSSTKGKEAADKLWADSGVTWVSLLKHSSIDEFKQMYLKF